jgi:hypothetical protein
MEMPLFACSRSEDARVNDVTVSAEYNKVKSSDKARAHVL